MIQQKQVAVEDLPSQCQRVIENLDNYAILDSETTGLHGPIIDLAITDPAGRVLFDKLLRPKCAIEEEAIAIHGITEDMVAEARSFAEEWSEISEALKGRTIIVYNAKFDKARLEHTARVHGITLPSMTWRCMMDKYATFYGAPGKYERSGPRWQKLEIACAQQGIVFKQTHRALGDAQATAMLIRRIAELGDDAGRYVA
ncbi:MAG TPA: 3'-5' exonuclease [Ktedonobacteraceae bacterium]|nr:3'-5' exonuclease [Ktedonobacteraceae bacterium]